MLDTPDGVSEAIKERVDKLNKAHSKLLQIFGSDLKNTGYQQEAILGQLNNFEVLFVDGARLSRNIRESLAESLMHGGDGIVEYEGDDDE